MQTRAPSRAPPSLTRGPDSYPGPSDSDATSGDESDPRGPSRATERPRLGQLECTTRTLGMHDSFLLGQLECTTRTPSHARSCTTRIPRVRLGCRVMHYSCTTRIPRIRLGRRVAHRVVQLGIRVGTRRSDSAVRVGGPAARLGAREGPRVGAKESDSGPARGHESDRVCTVGSQVPVGTLPTFNNKTSRRC